MNAIALRSLGFKACPYHYLSVTSFPEGAAGATKASVRALEGFHYWSLSDSVADLEAQVLGHFENPVDDATLRDWHSLLITQVEKAAVDFASKH